MLLCTLTVIGLLVRTREFPAIYKIALELKFWGITVLCSSNEEKITPNNRGISTLRLQ